MNKVQKVYAKLRFINLVPFKNLTSVVIQLKMQVLLDCVKVLLVLSLYRKLVLEIANLTIVKKFLRH